MDINAVLLVQARQLVSYDTIRPSAKVFATSPQSFQGVPRNAIILREHHYCIEKAGEGAHQWYMRVLQLRASEAHAALLEVQWCCQHVCEATVAATLLSEERVAASWRHKRRNQA
jgi:hypothetical protein